MSIPSRWKCCWLASSVKRRHIRFNIRKAAADAIEIVVNESAMHYKCRLLIEIPCIALQSQDRCVPVHRSIMHPMCRVTSFTQTALLNRSIRLLHGSWMEFSFQCLHFRGRGLTHTCTIQNQPLRAAVIILETTHANWLLLHQLKCSSHLLQQMRPSSTNPVRYKVCMCDLTKRLKHPHRLPKYSPLLRSIKFHCCGLLLRIVICIS